MVDGDGEVAASQHEVPRLVQCVNDGEGLTFYGRVPGLCCVGESAADERDFPAGRAAEGFWAWATAVLLEEPVADPVLRPVGGQAGRFTLVEDSHAVFYLLGDDGF